MISAFPLLVRVYARDMSGRKLDTCGERLEDDFVCNLYPLVSLPFRQLGTNKGTSALIPKPYTDWGCISVALVLTA